MSKNESMSKSYLDSLNKEELIHMAKHDGYPWYLPNLRILIYWWYRR